MKKSSKRYITDPEIKPFIVSEPATIYNITYKQQKKEVLVKDFKYQQFKKIADKSPFTLAEWADLLFISERTLHRYAKDDGNFNGLQIERILLLEQLINTANELFGTDGFKTWLDSKPFSLGGAAVKEKLTTHNGIQEVIDTLQRMQHGISA